MATRRAKACRRSELWAWDLASFDLAPRPNRARASELRDPWRRPWRRTRCAGPAARCGSDAMSSATPSLSSRPAIFLAASALRVVRQRGEPGVGDLQAHRRVGARSFVLGEEIRPIPFRAPNATSAARLAFERAISALRPPNALRPFERVEIILQRQHRRRVDRLAFEDAFDELAALGHAEDFRQRPGRRVGFEPRHRAGRQHQHAMCRFAAQHLLPGEGRRHRACPTADPSRRRHSSRRRS